MGTDDTIFKNRLIELAERSYSRGCYCFTDFLSLAEQDVLFALSKTLPQTGVTLHGGHQACERQMVRFGSMEQNGYEEPFPIACLRVMPKDNRFSEPLTHRDFLGAVMHLGVRRKPSAIFLSGENTAILFSLQSIAPFLLENLLKIRHTSVRCEILPECPAALAPLLSSLAVNVASERADAVVGAVYRLSRKESANLSQRKRYLSMREPQKSPPGFSGKAKLSRSGVWKFIYRGIQRETKKGAILLRSTNIANISHWHCKTA